MAEADTSNQDGGVAGATLRPAGGRGWDAREILGLLHHTAVEPAVAGTPMASCLVERPLELILAPPRTPVAPHRLKPVKHDTDATPEWMAAQPFPGLRPRPCGS